MTAGPYDDIRVLECGNGTACAFAGQILSDKGAEVIKVEPRQGDDLRWRDPHRRGESKAFQWLCRGKRSIIVDDDTEAGRAVLARLAGSVDVVLTNWPQSRLTKAGLDPAALLAVNPSLIVLSCSGFGAVGEWAERPANDLVLQAFSGLTVAEGKRRDDGTPDAIRCSEITQFSAGLMVAIGMGAALYSREHSGCGQIVRTSELGTALLMHCWRIGRNGPTGISADADERQLARGRARGASHGELAAPFGPPRDPVSNRRALLLPRVRRGGWWRVISRRAVETDARPGAQGVGNRLLAARRPEPRSGRSRTSGPVRRIRRSGGPGHGFAHDGRVARNVGTMRRAVGRGGVPGRCRRARAGEGKRLRCRHRSSARRSSTAGCASCAIRLLSRS